MSGLTHVDETGSARMVDVGEKQPTRRVAVASGEVRTRPDVIAAIREGTTKKGDVLAVARVAGIQGAKRTSGLIPLCHPLAIDTIAVDLELGDDRIWLRTTVASTGKTGVEMEALTGTAVAALTLYDMCKAMDREMTIGRIRLEEKSGGKSGHFRRGAAAPGAGQETK
ncbi:MAG: cyclic pyranopterin monophosphate synthase MoaC [bacterium]